MTRVIPVEIVIGVFWLAIALALFSLSMAVYYRDWPRTALFGALLLLVALTQRSLYRERRSRA